MYRETSMAMGALPRNRLSLRSRRYRLLPHRISRPFLCCSAIRRAMSIGRAIGGYTLGSLSSRGSRRQWRDLPGRYRQRKCFQDYAGTLVTLLQSLWSLSSLSESRWRTLRQGAHGGVIYRGSFAKCALGHPFP